jgi:pyrroline-5-carboxylate reductase
MTANPVLKISFIGYGNMAKAMAKSLSAIPCYQLKAASPSQQIGMNVHGIDTHPNNLEVLDDADIVILAVKPAKMQEVLLSVKEFLPKNCLLISVAAGLGLSWLAKYTPQNQAIVRSMPNIATAVNKGAIPLIANHFVNQQQKEVCTQLFAHMGLVSWLDNENELDIFTALSGSGPAYVFLFLEAMQKAAEQLGLAAAQAKSFSLQTIIGAADLAKESQSEFAELRKKVTSPAGTTAAAIQVLQNQQFEQVIFNAMEAAYNRAKELAEHS